MDLHEQVAASRQGTLVNLGPDGYGFVKEEVTGDAWAFPLALLPPGNLAAWDGQAVRFTTSSSGKVIGISAQSATLVVGV